MGLTDDQRESRRAGPGKAEAGLRSAEATRRFLLYIFVPILAWDSASLMHWAPRHRLPGLFIIIGAVAVIEAFYFAACSPYSLRLRATCALAGGRAAVILAPARPVSRATTGLLVLAVCLDLAVMASATAKVAGRRAAAKDG